MAHRGIEAIIGDVLKGDAQKNALDFVAHLRAKDIPLGESENYWEVKYEDECVCFIWIDGADSAPGPWTIWSAQIPGAWPEGEFIGEYADFSAGEHIREIVWANVNVCGDCGGCDHPGGTRKTILGKDFDKLCNSAIAFRNPDAEALICAKKMVDIRKSDILKSNKG